MGIFHQWRPIEDIPPQLLKLPGLGVEDVQQIWQSRRSAAKAEVVTELLRQRVNRRWAIETGVLEDLYKISSGATDSLILHGLNASLVSADETNLNPDRTVALIQDHVDALEVIFSAVKGKRPLTEGFIKELHASLVRNQKTYVGRDARGEIFEVPLDGGVYKLQPNSVKRADGLDHEYCPPIHVSSEMDQLVKMHLAHCDSGVPPAIQAAWLQARSLQVRGRWTFNISSPGALHCLYLFVGESRSDSGFVDVYQAVNQHTPDAEPFKMHYLQTSEQVLERFKPWLDARLKEALVRWRATL